LKPPEVRKYLFDMAEACGLIQTFVSGKSLDDYRGDPLLRSGVERQFEIVGEALSRLLVIAPDLSDRITNSRRIVSFRNRLIHGYASVADDVVWGIVEGNLPKLAEETQRLLDEE
jgi:uncharacterized protein with HEPN domain